jgi:hypothetical protein
MPCRRLNLGPAPALEEYDTDLARERVRCHRRHVGRGLGQRSRRVVGELADRIGQFELVGEELG